MTEFTTIEQQMMAKDLSPDQKLLFSSQLGSTTKDRNMVLILSVIFGAWGVDRFYVGDMGMGLVKLFTLGGCGVIWLIDRFLIRGRADDYNRNKAHEILSGIRMTTI
jgi:TM2 domain-containing membrane protein YozV